MDNDRRFSDDEVARIFARAVEQQSSTPSTTEKVSGMTLAQLQAIATEAGIEPEAVLRAARELERPAAPPVPTVLGVATAASHVVDLPRRLSDEEWERFVVRLRQIFSARGDLSAFGSLRSWSNGNLQVHLEPNGRGHTLRFFTRSTQAAGLIRLGAWTLIPTVTFALVNLSAGVELASNMLPIALAAAAGIAVSVGGAIRTRAWRLTRQQQFEALGAELLRLTESAE